MTDASSPDLGSSPAIIPESAAQCPALETPRPRLWPGALAWMMICVVYVVVERLGIVEGLDLPVPLVVALVLARVVDQRPALRRWARLASVGLVTAGVGLAMLMFWSRPRTPLLDSSAMIGIVTVTLALVVLLVPRARRVVLAGLGLDPGSAVHLVTAIAAVVTLVMSAMLFVDLQSSPDETIYFHPFDSLVSLLSDAALALAGIGFLLTRGARAAVERLGLHPMRLRQVAMALALAGGFLVVVDVMERAEHAWLPALHAREDRFDYEFVGVSPAAGAVLLSVAAGIGEELVFRGALQPRLGVVLTAAIFAAVHVQYQVPGLAMIFVVGLGLGLIKRYSSTTFTVCVHVFYDIGAFLIPDV